MKIDYCSWVINGSMTILVIFSVTDAKICFYSTKQLSLVYTIQFAVNEYFSFDWDAVSLMNI